MFQCGKFLYNHLLIINSFSLATIFVEIISIQYLRVNWEQSLRVSSSTLTASVHNVTTTNEVTIQNDAIWDQRMHFIYNYGIAMVIVFYLAFQRTALFFHTCVTASRNLHDLLYRGITRSPMEFFNKNSSGRVLNRFSSDIGNIDTLLPLAAGDAILVSQQEYDGVQKTFLENNI